MNDKELLHINKFFINFGVVSKDTRYAKYLNRVRNKLRTNNSDLHPDVYIHFSCKRDINEDSFFNLINHMIFLSYWGLKNDKNIKKEAQYLLDSITGECGTYFIGDESDFNGIDPKTIRDYKDLKNLWETTKNDLQEIIKNA